MNERSDRAFSLALRPFDAPSFLALALATSSPLSPIVVVTLFQPTLMDRLHTLIADFFGRKTSSGQRFNRCRGGGSRQTFIWERESKGGRKSEKEREKVREGEKEEEWVREGARGVQRAGGSLLVHPGKTRPHRQPLYVDSTRCLVSLIFFFLSPPFFPFEHVDHCNRSVEAIPQPVLTADALIAPRFVYSIQLPHSVKIRSGWRINSFAFIRLFVHIKILIGHTRNY